MAAVARAEADWVAEDWVEHPGVEAMVTSAANSAQKVVVKVGDRAKVVKVGSTVAEVDRSAEAKMEFPAKVEAETAAKTAAETAEATAARPGVAVKVDAGSVVEGEVAAGLVAAATVAKGSEVVGPAPLASTRPLALFECRTLS